MATTAEISTSEIAERAWSGLQDDMAEAARTVVGPAGARSALERAEGFRYLTRLLAAGLEMHVEKGDVSRPVFTRMLSPTRKFLGDNPDVIYEYVPLDGRLAYRVRGRRGSEIYLAFCVYRRDAAGKTSIAANLSDAEMHFEDDGSFDVVLSGPRPLGARNWLALPPDAHSMIARQYFRDRPRGQPASLEIEAFPAASPPEPLSEVELAGRLAAVGRFVRETAELSAALSVFSALNPVGREAQAAPQVVGGELRDEGVSARQLAASIDPKIVAGHLPTPDIQYTGAWWSLAPDEAVVAEGRAPVCRYWSLQIFNRWLESPDYRYRQVALNDSQVVLNDDGSFRVVLAARNPGVPNWLDTAGHDEGQIVLRALLAKEPLDVRFRVVRLADLA